MTRSRPRREPVPTARPEEAVTGAGRGVESSGGSDGNNIALWYKWLAGRQLSDLEEDEEDGPIFTKASRAGEARQERRHAAGDEWLKETKEGAPRSGAARQSAGLRLDAIVPDYG